MAKIAIVLFLFFSSASQAQVVKPNESQKAAFKKLAAQSVLHVETSLKKLEQSGPLSDPAKIQSDVVQPAGQLVKEWQLEKLSDQVMSNYSACSSILSDLQVYAKDTIAPPKYHLATAAQQKLRFIKEDLLECKKLRSKVPAFDF